MASETLGGGTITKPRAGMRLPDTLSRLLKYVLFRGVALFVTVVIGVYLTILIANMGGYLDTIRKAQIQEEVGLAINGDPANKGLPASELRRMVEERMIIESKRLNLDQPFALRSVNYLTDALTLNLGRAEFISSDSGSRRVQAILVERMPATLLLSAWRTCFSFSPRFSSRSFCHATMGAGWITS